MIRARGIQACTWLYVQACALLDRIDREDMLVEHLFNELVGAYDGPTVLVSHIVGATMGRAE